MRLQSQKDLEITTPKNTEISQNPYLYCILQDSITDTQKEKRILKQLSISRSLTFKHLWTAYR